MMGILGNSNGIVKPWYLPFDWVFCRISINYKSKVFIVKNPKRIPLIYGLPVTIVNGVIKGIRK